MDSLPFQREASSSSSPRPLPPLPASASATSSPGVEDVEMGGDGYGDDPQGQGQGPSPSQSRQNQQNHVNGNGNGGKKSWGDLKEDVRTLRRKLWGLGFRLPHSFSFRRLAGTNKTRIYFMASPSNSRENSIYAMDIPDPDPDGHGHGRRGTQALAAMATTQFGLNPLVKFPWIQILASGFQGGLPSTKAELLMLERKRMTPTGIADYEFHEPSAKFLFSASSALYQAVDDPAVTEYPLTPVEIRTPKTRGARMNPSICPDNPNLIAYVNDGDIWVVHSVSGDEKRLTFARSNDLSIEEDPLSAGLPSYIMQEEFNRFEGFWWQPGSHEVPGSNGTRKMYRMLYEEVDESAVPLVTLLTLPGNESEKYRFPRPGSPNATSTLRFLQFEVEEGVVGKGTGSESGSQGEKGGDEEDNPGAKIINIIRLDLLYPIPQIFPWVEYIVRAGWHPSGAFIWAQLLDRVQQRLELVLFPFTPGNLRMGGVNCGGDMTIPGGPCPFNGVPPPSAPVYVLYAEKTDVWINVHDILEFLPFPQDPLGERVMGDLSQGQGQGHGQGQGTESGDEEFATFLWASEESGFRHLYLITSELRPALDQSWSTATHRHPALYLSPKVHTKRGLTSGDWEVLNNPVSLHFPTGLLFFMGLKDTPIERHLYVLNIHDKGAGVRRLTPLGHSFSSNFNESSSLLILTYSNVKEPPVCVLYRLHYPPSPGGKENVPERRDASMLLQPPSTPFPLHSLELEALTHLAEPPIIDTSFSSFRFPEIYCYTTEYGEELYSMVYKPFDYKEGKKYPTILNVYGGPEVQLVYNSFKGVGQLWLYLLASQGYCVVCVDSRGSAHRGTQFESHIRRRMGTVELSDQVEVLEWLDKTQGFLDLSRVGIYGWSYGGYLSLMGLIHYPHIFKVCVAGAPVTCWENYDSGYTERYMDLPQHNPGGYKEGSVLTYAHLFPEEAGRLLLVHGLSDENVHFFHTAQLINALVRWGKPYQLQLYPNERHSLRRLDASEHYETVLLSFLQDQLLK